MNNTTVNTRAATIAVEQHVILFDGPGGAIVSLTPEAAAETAARLDQAVESLKESDALIKQVDEHPLGDKSNLR